VELLNAVPPFFCLSSMDGKQCVSLGLEIAQLKKNIEGQQY